MEKEKERENEGKKREEEEGFKTSNGNEEKGMDGNNSAISQKWRRNVQDFSWKRIESETHLIMEELEHQFSFLPFEKYAFWYLW